jgi:hypothetical protein
MRKRQLPESGKAFNRNELAPGESIPERLEVRQLMSGFLH